MIDPEECLLISATRLDDVPLRVVADELGISVDLARRGAAPESAASSRRCGPATWTGWPSPPPV